MWIRRIALDVTSRESILEAKKVIEEKEGKLHVLVNKCVQLPLSFDIIHPMTIQAKVLMLS